MAVQSVKLTIMKQAVKAAAFDTRTLASNGRSDGSQQDLSWSVDTSLETIALLPFPQEVSISTSPAWEAVAGGLAGEKILANRVTDAGSALNAVKETLTDPQAIKAMRDAADRGLANAAGQVAGLDEAAKFVDAAKGLALNPREVMLFNGISHREFTITFNLSPTSADQSQKIAQFIRELHFHASPDIDGAYFTYPATFGFALIGDDNTVILDRGEVAVTNIDCNYTPDSVWATFNNNQPVHIVLTISFKEMELPTRGTVDRTFGVR